MIDSSRIAYAAADCQVSTTVILRLGLDLGPQFTPDQEYVVADTTVNCPPNDPQVFENIVPADSATATPTPGDFQPEATKTPFIPEPIATKTPFVPVPAATKISFVPPTVPPKTPFVPQS